MNIEVQEVADIAGVPVYVITGAGEFDVHGCFSRVVWSGKGCAVGVIRPNRASTVGMTLIKHGGDSLGAQGTDE